MARVVYTDVAKVDVLDAWLYIAQMSEISADHVLDDIEREAITLSLQPLMGRARPELDDRIRSWPTSTPYILFYTADVDGITLVRVLHHARDIGSSFAPDFSGLGTQ